MKHTFLCAFITGSALALLAALPVGAHPHDSENTQTKKAEKSWPYFGSYMDSEKTDDKKADMRQSRLENRFKEHAERIRQRMAEAGERADHAKKRHGEAMVRLNESGLLENPERISEAAKALEEMIAESGIISNMADMFVELAQDIEVDNSENGITLKFDGETLGRFSMDREAASDERFDIEGFGRNMTMDKQVIEKNGKKKVRIVIEMDADEDDEVEIEVKPKKGY